MISVLICDDEKSIREGLNYILDWEELGYEIVGEAANGDEALNQILDLDPGLVLMDIRMPGLEGIEVISKAKASGFTGKFIIISGFSDFSYAKEAIRLGVESYITKPIDEDELKAAVLNVKESIDAANQDRQVLDKYKNKARDSILHDIVYDRLDEKTALDGLGMEAPVYQVVIYENYSSKVETNSYSFADLMRVTNRENDSYEILNADSMDIIILKGQFSVDRFKDFLKHYEETPPQKGSPMDNIFVAYGRCVYDIKDIHLSFEDVKALINRRFFCLQGQHTLGYEELPGAGEGMVPLSKEKVYSYSREICEQLLLLKRSKVAETLYALEQYLFSVDATPVKIKHFIADIYFQVKEKVNSSYPLLAIPFPANSEVLTLLESKNYLYELIQYISEQFEMIINATGSTAKDTLFDEILYYIERNYSTNIKLETIAPLFGYNSAYLGRIFSKNMGMTFNSYVDKVRINESKKLLSQNRLKVYEVADAVGYSNVDYFHKKFKKYEGMSPVEYRKMQGGTDIG